MKIWRVSWIILWGFLKRNKKVELINVNDAWIKILQIFCQVHNKAAEPRNLDSISFFKNLEIFRIVEIISNNLHKIKR